MTPAELTALEAELREPYDQRQARRIHNEQRAADAIAELRRKLDEANRFAEFVADYSNDPHVVKEARRWMEDK